MLLKMSPDQNTNNAFEMVNTDIYINPSREKCLFPISINV